MAVRVSDFTSCLEVSLSAIYHRVIEAGDTVIDGGSNAGLHTMLMARIIGQTGKLYVYEPQIKTAEILQELMV